jgi:diaminohydroxyphosphoribosylaminopyrimidine deaminase / 5-amino-6-(5-phosphoribosylamino)uracil reductase
VGAIVVEPGTQKLLGRGVTAPGGHPFAETQAIEDAADAARGATLFLTLEPDGGAGEGQDSVDSIVGAGIARVVIGLVYPDPASTGKAAARLRAAGLVIDVADNPACRRLHEGYISRHVRRRPFVTAKLAISADGMIGRAGAGRLAIAGEQAERWTSMLRALSDAVMIGWGTAKADDPELDVGLAGLESRTPLRIVVAGLKTYQPRMKLVTAAPARPVAVVAIPEKQLVLPEGIETIRVKGLKGRPDLGLTLAALAARGVQSLLVEAGPTLTEALLAAGLVDRFHLVGSETILGPDGIPATARGTMEQRLVAAGFSLVDHRLLGADNLRTFERLS